MKFIRKNGRIIPIKEKSDRSITHDDGNGNKVKINLKDKKVSAGERLKRGAKAGAIFGGVYGGVIAAFNNPVVGSRAQKLAGFGAVTAIGAAVGGAFIGGLHALVGPRKETVVSSVEVTKKKLKKLKKG